MIKAAILGYGVVGSGVSELVRTNANSIARRAGKRIVIKKILDIRDFPDGPDAALLTKDAEDIFADPEIKIVVETIGGTGVAHAFTRRALEAGKHVVTSNKELVASQGPELMQLAHDHGVQYLFEASVGGGIPIIRPLIQCLSANEISEVAGILNGTTNYILTRMRRDGLDFSTALAQAQDKGYAEQDPTADIEGHDACRKLAILSSIAFDEFVDYRDIHTEGISDIAAEDMHWADRLGAEIKLIGKSERRLDGILARVSPLMVAKDHPLAFAEDVFNAILVTGNALGDAMFYGRGAGRLPTASAVVADMIDISKHAGFSGRHLWERHGRENVLHWLDAELQLYVRAEILSRDLVGGVFGPVEFASGGESANAGEVVFVTQLGTERELRDQLRELTDHAPEARILSVIRADLRAR